MEIEFDDDLTKRLSLRADEHGFESTEAYTTELVRTVLSELESEGADDDVAERLEDLGYL
ncbi:hypothetical protein [Halosimplex marinum]|uniref:hypothetical protein n=1 Tax=Halosimplex marinum TaxID=3396620 RepID=UPI003F552358